MGPDRVMTTDRDDGQRPRVVVHRLDGVYGVWIQAQGSEEIAALLERANGHRIYRGLLPLPMATEASRALRYAANLATMLRRVPHAEHELAQGNPSAGPFVTTGQAAHVLGITERAVRQRIERKRLPARRVGRDWQINVTDLGETA